MMTIVLVVVVTGGSLSSSSWDELTIWKSFRGTVIAVVCIECGVTSLSPPWFADIWIKTPVLDDALNMLLREYDWLLIVEDKEDFGKELVYQHHMLPQVSVLSGCFNIKEEKRWWSSRRMIRLCHGKVVSSWCWWWWERKFFDGFFIK